MGEKLLTAKEAAEILKVRKNTVYDMIKRGDLKASKLGKQLRIRQEDLDFYIQYGSQYGSQASTMLNEGKTQTNDIDKDEFEKNILNIPNGSTDMAGRNKTTQKGMANQIIICGQDMVLDLLANRLNQCIGRMYFVLIKEVIMHYTQCTRER